MKTINKKDWLEILTKHDDWNKRALLAAFAVIGVPPSYIDFGSGTGAMVAMARQMGIESLGIDRIAETPDYNFDLSHPLDLGKQYWFATSLEVAEHIAETKAFIFINNIAQHLKDGGYLIFTAAAPGQGGEEHVNLKPSYWWRNAFYDRRLHYNETLTYRLKLAWQSIPMPTTWLEANLQVFQKTPQDNGKPE